MLRQAAALVLLLGFAGAPLRGSQVRPPAPDPQPAPAEVQTLVREALEDVLNRDALPDGTLFRNARRIAVQAEMRRARLALGQDALPRREGFEYYLMSEEEIQAQAERTGASVYFVVVDTPVITGNRALLTAGVNVREPRGTRLALCCCIGFGQFERRDGRWRLLGFPRLVCA